MVRSVRLGLIMYSLLIGYGILSMAQAQTLLPPKGAAASSDKLTYHGYTLEQLRAIKPGSSNPYLSLLPPGVTPDMAYWMARMQAEARAKGAVQTSGPGVPMVEESEPNNTPATANPISDFGNGPGLTPQTNVNGSFPAPPEPTPAGPFPEDDGAIPLASDPGLNAGQLVRITAQIGDGPHGSSGSGSGDFDFYVISGVTAGQVITANINTQPPGVFPPPFDSFLGLWDSQGNLLTFNDDQRPSDSFFLDSFIQFTVPQDGDYYISVGSFRSSIPRDPFDSSSGEGIGTEGEYELILGLAAYDVDFFSLALNAGDVLNVNGLGAISHVSLFDPAGVELITSGSDITVILPEEAPFRGGGNPALVYLVSQPGMYAVRVTSFQSGDYIAELRTARPPLETAEIGTKQILFIDFDGATIDPSDFVGGPPDQRILSPLSSFLGNWGLQPDAENAVIDAILDVSVENLQRDIAEMGFNPQFDIEILNSRDHEDPFGQPNVSRVIVGGTIAESGIETIGIAQSIDVGNFATAESGLVLLDVLSGTNGESASVNTFPIAASASIIDFIGIAVGNIVAHEAGHFFGNFHTNQFNASENIMDQGGNPAGTFGVGEDGTFGTEDDVDVDFGLDDYVPNEGLVGIEDTLNVISFGLTSMPNDLTSASH
ncbi:PPC domain-containing protein [Candidatus Entotheonella palauensis]|uniref:PPC domain-containing protein n=1 Tax=Candidatus Entotheonella palauensis TaxID=93172 RepID=UPI000B7F14FB|nr:PPC domain-containing protein [Candidatus Entotheonella palauensis]